MKRFILIGAIALAMASVWSSVGQASFDFSVSNLSFDPNTGMGALRVSVTPNGETVPANVAGYSVPLMFSNFTGSISSVSIESLAAVGSVPTAGLSYGSVSTPQIYGENGAAYVTPASLVLALSPFNLTSGLNPLVDVNIKVSEAGSFDVDVVTAAALGQDLALLDGTSFAALDAQPGGGTTVISAVPEPSSFLFMGLACVLGFGVRKVRQSRAAKAA